MSAVPTLIVIITTRSKINSHSIFCASNKCLAKTSAGINPIFILKAYDANINSIKNTISAYKLKPKIKKIHADSAKPNNTSRYLLMLSLMVSFFVSETDKIPIVPTSM